MNPGNNLRPYEVAVLILGALNMGIGVLLSPAGQATGVIIPPVVMLAGLVLQAMIPFITNRLDSLGQPQGVSYVQFIDQEGKPTNPPVVETPSGG